MTTFHTLRRLASKTLVASALSTCAVMQVTSPTHAVATAPSCTASLEPSVVTIDANEDLSQSSTLFTFDTVELQDWPTFDFGDGSGLVPVTYIYMGMAGTNVTIAPTVVTAYPVALLEEQSPVETYNSDILSFMSNLASTENAQLTSGTYTLTYDFSSTSEELTRVCGVAWTITFIAEGDSPTTTAASTTTAPAIRPTALPETGTSSGALIMWAMALVGLGSVSVRTLARRRS